MLKPKEVSKHYDSGFDNQFRFQQMSEKFSFKNRQEREKYLFEQKKRSSRHVGSSLNNFA